MKNKSAVFLLSLLVVVAGCGKKNKKAQTKVASDEVSKNIDIPVAGDATSFFDSELGEYTLADDKGTANKVDSDFTFEDADKQGFKAVCFDFNDYGVRRDQEENVAFNIAHTKQVLADAQAKGVQATAVISGHASEEGSAAYNLALSEKRAKTLQGRFVAEGIAPESIKIVGRGKEIPAIVDGMPCVGGDRAHQAPNRRDEVRVMFN